MRPPRAHAPTRACVHRSRPAASCVSAVCPAAQAFPIEWKPGEVAALDAAMLGYDRDLLAIHENAFSERRLKEVVWHYYRHGAFRRHQHAAQALGTL